MDNVSETFDKWAKIGRAELMEREHKKTVLKFLNEIKFEKPFIFLDVGCGNGWIVREISKKKNCVMAVGIDKSKNMILSAKSKKESQKEHYVNTDLLSWKYKGCFDFVFSMESLYYSKPMEKALAKIYKLLKKNGKFFCGTDYYKDNKATTGWAKMLEIPLDLRSKNEWKKMFRNVGFQVKTKQVKDPKNKKKWKREFGTLFVIGTKI